MIYVTSDLHGIAPEALRALLRKADFTDADTLFVLGDTVDRGEYGVELLLWMMEQPNVIHLLGNHEAMLLAASGLLFATVTDESLERLDQEQFAILSNMLLNGAQPTLTGLKRLAKRDSEQIEALLDYLREMPLYDSVEVGDVTYVLVHAGLGNFAPDKMLSSYTPDELLWHRPERSERYFGGDVQILFGHTPTGYYGAKGEIVRTDTWCCIDTSDVSPTLLRLEDGAVFT